MEKTREETSDKQNSLNWQTDKKTESYASTGVSENHLDLYLRIPHRFSSCTKHSGSKDE